MTMRDSGWAQWDVFDIEKTLKPKTKNAYVPPYIYLFIILILIGIAIGLYFFLRENNDDVIENNDNEEI